MTLLQPMPPSFLLLQADAMVRYLGEFAGRLGLRVRYNTAVRELRRHPETAARPQGYFSLTDQHSRRYSCRYVEPDQPTVVPHLLRVSQKVRLP